MASQHKTQKPPSKNPVQRFIDSVDSFQQKHKALAFPYALVKKYGDDEGGYQGALITYYGFLALFPLLIVATSVVGLIAKHDTHLRTKLLADINSYFPIVGSQLQSSVHSSSRTGLALVFGLIITFFGARGVADAIRHALDHVWEVPKAKRAGFPKGPLKSLALIAGGGLGLLVAALLSSYATATFGYSFAFRLLPIALSFLMLLGVYSFVFRVGMSTKRAYRQLLPGAAVAAFGMQILQTLGGYLITHQLRNLNGAYGQFGLVLAILFWLYLQAQVFLYAVEINTVRAFGLWPRSITNDPFTPADRSAFKLYAERETYQIPAEEVNVRFKR